MTTDELIQLCHDRAHDAEHNFEDTLFCSLTQRDIWTLCLGCLLIESQIDCLTETAADILERMSELLDSQKPHWRTKEDG